VLTRLLWLTSGARRLIRHSLIGLRPVRNWRIIDFAAVADDLRRSELVTAPPVSGAFVCYDETLSTILNGYARLELKCVEGALQRAGMTVTVGL
jgi:hypothetical protein